MGSKCLGIEALVKTDNSFSEKVCYNKQKLIIKVVMVSV
jgi:hypothetical protein